MSEWCFNMGFAQWAYNFMKEYFKKYNSLPSKLILQQSLVIDTDFKVLPEESILIETFFTFIDEGLPPGEEDWVRETARKFATTRQIKYILNEQSPAIDDGDFDTVIGALRTGARGLVKRGGALKDEYVFSLRNLEEIYTQEGGIKTGVPLIDQWVGGLFKKELTLVLADTNVGKSLLMCYIGGQILRQGKRVLHVTLEMSLARTLLRYFATLAEPDDGITYNDILGLTDVRKVHEYSVKTRERYEGLFHIEELPSGKATMEDLYRFLDKYQNPEVLIVDYLDLIKPDVRREHKRFELGETTTNLRAVAMEASIAVLTPTQASKLSHHRRLVDVQYVAEDYEKVRIADTVVGMGQSQDDSIRHEIVMMLSKSRNTVKDKAERYTIDYPSMMFRYVRPELLGSARSE